MRSGGPRSSLVGFPFRKRGISTGHASETACAPESPRRQAINDASPANAGLDRQIFDLQIQNTKLQTYAHFVAHDLKDPLTTIIAAADLIGHIEDISPEESGQLLQQIRSTAYDMDKIIDNLLLLSEVESTEAPFEVVDMSRAVSNVLRHHNQLIEESQARIEFPGSWPNAIGYEPWVEEIWANYLTNALKHGGRPPAVELGASPDRDGMVRFWTRDHGPGITPQTQARIFTATAPLSRSRRPGHGIGLSIVVQIIEKLGGKVGVESQTGEGSLFYFTLRASPPSVAQVKETAYTRPALDAARAS